MEQYMKIYQKQGSNNFSHDISTNSDFYRDMKIEERKGKQVCLVNIQNGKTIYKHIFKGYEALRYKTDTGKLFTYAIGFLDGNVSKFKATTFFKDRNLPYDGRRIEMLKDDLRALTRIDGVEWEAKNGISIDLIIISAKLKKGTVTVKFNDEFIGLIHDLYFYIPQPLFTTKDKLYPHSWSIGYEIYLQMMQNHRSGKFNLDIGRLVKLLRFDPYMKSNRQKQLIYEPFRRDCEYLNDLIPSLNIEVPEYTRNFKDKYITVEVNDKNLIDKYSSNSIKNNIIAIRTDAKIENIKIARALKNEGFTIKKIAETLKISTRTVNRYIKS